MANGRLLIEKYSSWNAIAKGKALLLIGSTTDAPI
jgi:hypothetical protein